MSLSRDTAGPMARTVRDTAILLGGMVGVDSEDAVTAESRGRFHTDYTQFRRLGYAFEQATRARKKPQFLTTLNVGV